MKLQKGIYESLISSELNSSIRLSESEGLVCKLEDIDSAESTQMLTDYVAEAVKKRLSSKELNNVSVAEKIAMVNQILEVVKGDDSACCNNIIDDDKQYLSAVIDKQTDTALKITKQELIRPLSGFRVSNLFTGGNSMISLFSEIERELDSSDSICMIVSFLRMSGVNLIYEKLKHFSSIEGHTLRIITTTYGGITEGKAVERLSELPNTEIKISYNTKIERLHAKSYIFHRESGFDTAYIGSSNLSKSAHTEGLEWNIRVTNIENPHIIKAAQATFDKYWDSINFEDFRKGGINRFNEKKNQEKKSFNPSKYDLGNLQLFSLLPHQKEILDKLEVQRSNGIMKNLIVSSTGTGKTVISAFDYKHFRSQNPEHSRLLFIAHREEILKQAHYTYKSVLADANFGDLWVGNFKPTKSLDNLFISVQTAHFQINTLKDMGEDYYDYIVFDEAHHIKADTYRELLEFFKPKLLLGLTATPERMDGKSLLPDFDNRISAEIRLPKALEEGLLSPFHYLCISDYDNLNLNDSAIWDKGKYITSELSKRLSTKQRAYTIYNSLKRYLSDETEVKALCFCADKSHANYMADIFNDMGLRSASLTSDTLEDDRVRYKRELGEGRINYLCVVDIFNEGVDIPEIDTVLFLRPTESLTIFLQQLGRGLRLSPGKEALTVLDFVAQANENYDYASRFRTLLTRSDANVEKQIKCGFTLLPLGCYIKMEDVAQKHILDNIHGAIFNIQKLRKELSLRSLTPTLSEFIEGIGQDVRLIYRGSSNCWTTLKRAAGKCEYIDDKYTTLFAKGMHNFVHINAAGYIAFLRQYINNDCTRVDSKENEAWKLCLYYSLYQAPVSTIGFLSVDEALRKFLEYPLFVKELSELLDYIVHNVDVKTYSIGGEHTGDLPSALEQYGCYTREEVFTIFGSQTAEKQMKGSVSGVFDFKDFNTEVFFVTLNKSDKDFSPTTQYDDYLISERKFHWQSQNIDSHQGRGSRFVEQSKNHKRFILFVREFKQDAFGNTCPFYCFGELNYLSSHGDKPMNIEWELLRPALGRFLEAV